MRRNEGTASFTPGVEDEIARSVREGQHVSRDASLLRLAELRVRNEALSARGLTAASLLPKLRGGVGHDYASEVAPRSRDNGGSAGAEAALEAAAARASAHVRVR